MKADHEIRVAPSLLDRLIDLEPKSRADVAAVARRERSRAPARGPARSREPPQLAQSPSADLSPDFDEVGSPSSPTGCPTSAR